MFTVNMMGSDKRPPLVIGKAARPSALKKKNVLLKNLKIEYYNNTRAWMNGPIFHSYMKNWNDELVRQRCHILLLIDNVPSHIIDEYSNINIQFLPPNTTSKIQPLDQGIIRSVKCAYRKTIQVQYCSRVENYEEVKQIMQSFDFVVAVNTLVDAWVGVKPELIQTCFHTAGFMTYMPPPPEPLPEPPRNLWERMQNIFDVNCTFEEYATADEHAESSQPMTDEDIINAVRNHDSPSADSECSTPDDPDLISYDDLDAESNDDGIAANESEIIHTSNQFLHILDQMKAYALCNQLSWEAHTSIDNLSSILVQSKVRTARIQTDISTYFNSPQQ